MFEDGFRLEIMRIAGVERLEKKEELNYEVFCHIAVSAGTEEKVRSLTELLGDDGYNILGGPRRTETVFLKV